jgi:hypothetical protein
MKQKLYILGLAATMIMSTGAIFKVNHLPGASVLLIFGTFLLVVLFFPAALINNYRVEGNPKNRVLYIVTYITVFVIFTSMLFKIMHWPYAGIGLMIALPFPYLVFLPVFLVVTSGNKNFNIFNTVFVLFLLAMNSVFAILLALNVSKQAIDDSYHISGNYNKMAEAIAQLPPSDKVSAINMKIDEIIQITDSYRELILKHEDMTPDQWESTPGILLRPENPNIAASVLADNGEVPAGLKLEKALNELLVLMQQTKGYEDASKALPEIFGLGTVEGEDPAWTFSSRNIIISLSWALTYLDGLQSNLLMIRASLI